eukprot:16315670-Heterocapsa_arctica.AAC.1
MNDDITDEQTNHRFFNGKDVRKKAMLKAKQIQMHKKNTTKNRLNKDENDNRNEEATDNIGNME